MAALVASGRQARADDDARPPLATVPGLPSPARDDFAAFPLVTPHEKHYLRAGFEIGGILGVGFVDYLLNTAARGGTFREGDTRWSLRYSWPTLREKLTGDIELDSNKFTTNYIGHPFAGTLYFTAARSNHLSFAESVLFAVAGSALWDYFGEITETTSLNDQIVTPMAGAAIGEATMQLAGFFDRGQKSFSNRLLSFLFSPVKTINEATDGAVTAPAATTDALGLATEPWHRFAAEARMGVTTQEGAGAGFPRASYVDYGVAIDLRLANLPGYAGAARRARLFDDGNVSSLTFDATFSRGQLVDALFTTRVVPLGFYTRAAWLDAERRPHGSGAMLGLRMGFEYGMHDYDRDRARDTDLVSVVSPLGIAAEHVYDRGRLRIRTALDIYGAMAGVTPYALGATPRSALGLPTATKKEGYYHSFAVSVAPSLSAAWHPFEWVTMMRFDRFDPIQGADEAPEGVDRNLRLADRRTCFRTAIAWTPQAPWRISLTAQHLVRAGDVGAVTASRAETAVLTSVGGVF